MNLHWLALKGKVQKGMQFYASSLLSISNPTKDWVDPNWLLKPIWPERETMRHKFTELEVLKHFLPSLTIHIQSLHLFVILLISKKHSVQMFT